MHFYNKETGIINKSTTWRDFFMGMEFLSIYSIKISEVKRKKNKNTENKKSCPAASRQKAQISIKTTAAKRKKNTKTINK